MIGELYIVATPIGNLDDLSPRGLKVLSEVDLIAAEDTRHTRKLLSRFGIGTGMISYFRGREASRGAEIIKRLESGSNVALVSDAGTPGISDPGWLLVDQALNRGIRVVPIPGPCAAAVMASIAGFAGPGFLFIGFLPAKKKARLDLLAEYENFDHDLIFYESPRRIIRTLEDIMAVMGDRRIAIGRELTKLNEEIIRGDVSQVVSKLVSRPSIKGEFVVMLEHRCDKPVMGREEIVAGLKALKDDGRSLKEAVALVSQQGGCAKKKIYAEALCLWGKK